MAVKYYYVKIQKGDEVKEHQKLKVSTSIENIVATFGSYGWMMIEYYQVFENDETKSVETSIDSEEVKQEVAI